MIQQIIVNVIPHKAQRYDTPGDWFFEDDVMHVRVSETGDWRSNMAVVLHEFVEACICTNMGVEQEVVDRFDKAYSGEGEPGDEPEAPYYFAHQMASALERMFVAYLDLLWKDHEDHVCTVSE